MESQNLYWLYRGVQWAFLFEHEVSSHSCSSAFSSCSEQDHVLLGCFLPSLEFSCQITLLPRESTDFSPVPFCIFMLLGRWSPHPIIAILFWYKAILVLPSPILSPKQGTWIGICSVLSSCLNSIACDLSISSIHLGMPFLPYTPIFISLGRLDRLVEQRKQMHSRPEPSRGTV